MQDSLSDRVYDLVAQKRGVRREGTTLSHDLGMEGDDAVEFFEDFAARIYRRSKAPG